MQKYYKGVPAALLGGAMFTGSTSENRINIGVPPLLLQELYDEARLLGMKTPEYIRHILLCWREDRMTRREYRK
jgi:hypothetical protein